ncbi:hypothetical protein ASD78_07415 [Lysobacter sp. Root667]|uniref:hypothetical protein n=1 Tax=Lysobacter sp. Root667 TaxID=1736581 RepID=UPI0006F563D6|nr:hypothetical protein [Lysobacter sp. Root667]KRA75787.1 hypothetical protein ASD78_07415 [Lysobacter sp. Root667]
MLEFLFELIVELILQIVGEVLIEIGLHSMAKPLRKRPDPWLAALGYALLGAFVGWLSLLVFPDHLMREEHWRIANLILTPLLAGAALAWLGAWRAKRGQMQLRIDRFSYAYLFALCMALVRFSFAG